MEISERKVSRLDSEARSCKTQNSRLLAQNKKLMAQLEQMSSRMSKSRSVTSSSEGAVKETSSEEEEEGQTRIGNTVSGMTRKKLSPRSRMEASISSTISELRHDDLEKELKEEKKMRQMAENQRDEAVRTVEDLRHNLAKSRAKLKDRSVQLSVSNSQELVNLRLENETLLSNLKESSTELTKLNAENQSLIEERALGEVDKERFEEEKKRLKEAIRTMTTELGASKSQVEALANKLDKGDAAATLLQAESQLLRQEVEHLKEVGKSVVSLESLKSCGLFHTSSDFRLELTSTEIALRNGRDKNDDKNDDVNDGSTTKWDSFVRDLDAMKRQSREGEKNLVKMMAAIEALEKERDSLTRELEETRRRGGDLDQKAGEAQMQMRNREAQMQQLLKEVEEKGDELNDVCVENERLKKFVDELKRDAFGKERESQGTREEIDRMRVELGESKDLNVQLEEKTNRLKAQIKSLQEINDVFDNEKTRLTRELREKGEEAEEAERKLGSKEEEMESKISHYENLISDLKKTKKESEQSLNVARQKAETINEERKEMLVEFEGLKATWEEKLNKQKTELHKLTKLVKKYKEREAVLKDETTRKEEANEALRRSLEDERTSLKDYAECYARLEKQLSESVTATSKFKEEASQNDVELRRQLRDANDQLRRRDGEISSLRSSVQDLESKLREGRDSLGALKSQVEINADAFVRKDAERERLERLVKDAKGVLANQSGTISDLERKIVQLDGEVKAKDEAIRAKDGEIERLQSERDGQKNQWTQIDGKMKDLINQMEEMTRECALKDGEIERLVEKQKEARSTRESLEKVISDQKREMWQRAAEMKQVDMALQEHRSDTGVTVRKLETALNQSLLDLKDKVEEVEKLGQELKSKERLCREMKDAAARAEANSFIYKERVDELESKFEGDKKQIDQLKGEKNALDLKLNLCQDQLKTKQSQLINANQEMQQLQDLVTQLEQRVDASLLDQRETINLKKDNEQLRVQMAEINRESAVEIKKLNSLVDSNTDQYRRDLQMLKDAQESTLKQREVEMSRLKHELEANIQENVELEKQLAEFRQIVFQMKNELNQRTLIVDEANEALTMKDCQIAKLEGKLAALDRLDQMTASRPPPPPPPPPSHSGSNNNDNASAPSSSQRSSPKYQPLSSRGFLEMASSVGVAPLRVSPPQNLPPPLPPPLAPLPSLPPTLPPFPSSRVQFDSYIREKERTPSPRSSLSSRPVLDFSPPRFSPNRPDQYGRLSSSPPIPSSLRPTATQNQKASSVRHSHPPFRPSSPPSPTLSSSISRPTYVFSPPAQSAASELDVRFKGVIQYLKENGKCDDELEEIGREMKATLKRSLIDRKTLERSTSTPVGELEDSWRRTTLDSTIGTVAMESELESAENQLKDLEAQLKANADKRADIDSQLRGFVTNKKFH